VIGDDTIGGAAQLAADHCPNEQTLDPAAATRQDPLMPQPTAPWP